MSLAEALRAEAAAVESQLGLLERLLYQLRAAAVTAELLEASDTGEVAVPVLSIEDLAEMGRESARQFACDAPVAAAAMGGYVAHQIGCSSLSDSPVVEHDHTGWGEDGQNDCELCAEAFRPIAVPGVSATVAPSAERTPRPPRVGPSTIATSPTWCAASCVAVATQPSGCSTRIRG